MIKKSFVFILMVSLCIFITGCSANEGNKPEQPVPKRLNIQVEERKVKNNVYLQDKNLSGFKESELRELLKTYEEKLNKQPKNAILDERKWNIIESERKGKRVKVEETVNLLLNASEGEKHKLLVEEIKPSVTKKMLMSRIKEISSFSTPLLDKREGRITNIEIASEKINYKQLSPGEEFSFNRTVGRRSEEKGYEEAPIIIKTENGFKKGVGVGGGVCQLATTIYNAVENAGFEITERHIHSKGVGYVPKGQDATVSYGSVDFKFINNKSYPIMIKVDRDKKNLTITILGNTNG
ncbi:MAG: VanW family protein [Clostridia bacterium]|nr:VanW family protein [Clostridia bacterium]